MDGIFPFIRGGYQLSGNFPLFMKLLKSLRIFIYIVVLLSVGDIYATSPQYLALVDSADNYIKREQWMKAEHTIISALRLEPANRSNSLLFSNLGVVRTEQGKFNDALEAFGLGLSIAPESKEILNNRARTLMLMNDYGSALSDLSESLKMDSIQEWPLQMRGLLRINANDTTGAKHDFLLLARNFHKNDCAFTGLAKIAEWEGNYDDALKYYNEAIIIKDDPDTRSERIMLKIKTDKYSDASQDIKESIDRYPQEPVFYMLRGYLHRLNYRYEEAEADKKIAINKGADPQFVEQFIPKTRR